MLDHIIKSQYSEPNTAKRKSINKNTTEMFKSLTKNKTSCH